MKNQITKKMEHLQQQEAEFYLKPLLKLQSFIIPADVTHSHLQFLANCLVEPVTEGNKSAIMAMEELKAIKQIIDYALEKIEGNANDEAMKYGKGETIPHYLSSEIKYSQGRRTYDFSNSPAIVELENKLKEMKELAKKVTSNTTILDGDEVIEINKPIEKYGKETISITFKK